jgi:K+/H+ antiporter YhaU regulatory subunit KhtT
MPTKRKEEPMLDNMNYNLIENVSIISKSLYRYETYIKDASQCKSCQELWSKFEEQRKKELSMILKELKAHIDAGKLTLA